MPNRERRKSQKSVDDAGTSTPNPFSPPQGEAGDTRPGDEGTLFARVLALTWKRILLIAFLCTLVAWGISALQTPQYRASALVSVAPNADMLQPNELLRGVEVLERRTVVATIAALAATPVSRVRVAALPADRIEAVVLPNTNLVRIDVEDTDAARAATIANKLPAVLDAQARALYRYYGVTTVSPASRPAEPFLPRTERTVMAGLVIGLFVGLLTAYMSVRSRLV